LLVAGVALVGCARYVKQDEATGPDGVAAGAVPIALEEEERADPKAATTYRGQAQDVVSYPGGDRIDWKVIELPAKQLGTLELRLTWTSPRTGLRLAFEVFDAKANRVAAESGRAGRSREATIEGAAGTYFVRVYAQRRADAGTYKLVAEFKPAAPKQDPRAIEVPLPPPLPAIPIPRCPRFDESNPECQRVCDKAAPSGWRGCPPCHKFSRSNPDCQDACPPDAPRSHQACKDLRPPCEAFDRADPKCLDRCPKDAPANWPACVKARPIVAEIKGTWIEGDEIVVLLKLDPKHPVTADWTAELLAGQKDRPLAGGRGKIISANGPSVKVRFKVTKTTADDNPRVRLSPPPGGP
jgi:hypothetical protein